MRRHVENALDLINGLAGIVEGNADGEALIDGLRWELCSILAEDEPVGDDQVRAIQRLMDSYTEANR